jgi:hypothetical protein
MPRPGNMFELYIKIVPEPEPKDRRWDLAKSTVKE